MTSLKSSISSSLRLPAPTSDPTAPRKPSTVLKELACNSAFSSSSPGDSERARADPRSLAWPLVIGTMIIAGWSDASAGPLLPYIQAYYGISYTVVSTLFIGQMVGFLSAGFLNAHLTEKYGLGKTITLGAFIQVLGYIFLVPAFPFPIMPCCYAIIGFGMALQDAAANTYVATLEGSQQKFGFLHASYGVGALVCPLTATAFASSGIRFSLFYTTSIALSLINAAVLLGAFKFSYRVVDSVDDEEEVVELEMARVGRVDVVDGAEITREGSVSSKTRGNGEALKKRGKLEQTLRNKEMWICSLFIFVYVGAEVAMGGWIITFLVDSRNGGPSAGYVASGFWGGITLGRALLPWFNVYVGERRVVFLYLFIAFALEFAIWFARNLIADAVVVGLVGLVMGPLYPVTMVVAVKVIPRSIHSSSIGFIAAFGQTGSAIFPFMVGALAQRFSTSVLQPVMVALFTTLAVLWWFVPAVDRKRD